MNIRIAFCTGFVLSAGFALSASLCHAQTELKVTTIDPSGEVDSSSDFHAGSQFQPISGIETNPEVLPAPGEAPVVETQATPGTAYETCPACQTGHACQCHPYVTGPGTNFVEACDCDGHRRRYGYPWCISQHCLSAAPYGDPHAFNQHERPFGSFLRSYLGQQVNNGVAARMVLFHYDFHSSESDRRLMLNAHGRDRLLKFANLMACYPYPLTIEASRDPELDEQRRQLVTSVLQSTHLVPDAHDRVQVDHPHSRGLDGAEAIEIYQNMLINTQTAGSIPLRGIDLGTTR